MQRFEDRVALITGGCGGVGAATAKRLLSEGARVVLADSQLTNAPDVLRELEQVGNPLIAKLDVTSEANWVKVVNDTIAHYGKLNVLINAAGVVSPEPTPLEEFTLEEWRRVFRINAEGVFLGMKVTKRALTGQVGAAIVNIVSISAQEGSRDHAIYGASKGAVRTLTRHAALGFSAAGIRVNAIHPGLIWTPMISPKATKRFGSAEAAQAAFRTMNPMGKILEPADVAAAIAFLASDDAKMVTGAELTIDGGRQVCGKEFPDAD